MDELNKESKSRQFGAGNLIQKNFIDQSKGKIDAKIRMRNDEINAFKITTETNERDRRFNEEIRRQERYDDIQNESMMAARKNAELEMRWSEYKEIEECEELDEAISEHKEAFQALIDSKDNLINTLWKEIRGKDDEYLNHLQLMKDEVENLSTLIQNQFWELRQMGIVELGEIEENLKSQRKTMLDKNKEYISSLFEKHRNDEEQRTQKRQAQEDDNFIQLQKLRIGMEKNFADLKITMETEIQNCEKCYEDMKALYQLNSEKLGYNWKVLTEKDKENKNLKEDLKDRERSFNKKWKDKDTDYLAKQAKYTKMNKKFTEDYKGLSKRYKELHKKFQHFVKADIDRYNEIKEMNQAEIEELKSKIIKCDKIIHMQQLGVVWEPHQIMAKDNTTMNGEDGANSETANKDKEVSREHNQTEVGQSKNESVTGGQNKEGTEAGNTRRGEEEISPVPESETHAIINIVLRETEFLLDDKIMDEIKSET